MADDRLALAVRNGLPAEIAYLRDTHPAAGWRAHRNFGDLSAFWLDVHATLRVEARAVEEAIDAVRHQGIAAEAGGLLVPPLNRFLQHLDAHHRIEDEAYFPRFRALDPRMVAGFDLLERDHDVIHAGIAETVAAARRLLAALPGARDPRERALDDYARAAGGLARLADRHLADEEDLVIPALLAHGERSIG